MLTAELYTKNVGMLRGVVARRKYSYVDGDPAVHPDSILILTMQKYAPKPKRKAKVGGVDA